VRQIGWLRHRLDVELSHPDGGSVKPTDEAMQLVAHARAVIDEAERFDYVARSLILCSTSSTSRSRSGR
jgi:DNA-binding transcriptional LysR family regulator